MAKKDDGQKTPDTYNAYVESEQSLLEQIRAKEEELNSKISAEEQKYSVVIENARKEALDIIGQYRHTAEAEAAVFWQQTMEQAGTEVEKIRSEGERRILADREKKKRKFNAVVDRVVHAVRNDEAQ